MSAMWKHGLVAAAVVSTLVIGGCATRSRVAPTNLCEDLKVSIYFDDGSARITRDARQVLAEAREMRTTCALGVVEVLGLADAVGDPGANLLLSEQRAKAVTQALGGFGFGNVRIAAAGASGAETASGEARPLRRRADVVFKSSSQ
ncbi:MAG: OmpA family protein [Caulobacter sp.]|nr:OmpA family protein [Caulobacter sp.]